MKQTNLKTNFARTIRRFSEKPEESDEEEDFLFEKKEHVKKPGDVTCDQFFKNKLYSDIDLITYDANGKEIRIPCHKIVLASHGEKLKDMIKGSNLKELKVEVDPKSLLDFVEYMYTGKLKLNADTVNDIVLAADKLGLRKIQSECFEIILKSVTKDTCIEMLLKADRKEFKFDTTELVKKCNEFLGKKCHEIVEARDQFNLLPKDMLIEILKDDKLIVDEVELCKAVIDWGKNQIKVNGKGELKDYIEDLLKHIRFGLFSIQELVEFVKPLNLAPKKDYIKALEFNHIPERYKDSPLKLFKSRGTLLMGSKLLTAEDSVKILGWVGDKSKKFELCYR
jgi:hypothetical protein